MKDGGIFFKDNQFRHAHRAVGADTAEVIALEVDDHHQFGTVFFAGKKLLPIGDILFRCPPPRPGTLDGASLDHTMV